jgi:7-cyano-7-deazaguanine reductase
MANDWLLGQQAAYAKQYDPDLLCPIPRSLTREEMGIKTDAVTCEEKGLPFYGVDIWNLWELSWLNNKGKPLVASAELQYNANSPYIVESKSLKLYLNSLNQQQFDSVDSVKQTIENDLSKALETKVTLDIVTEQSRAPALHQLNEYQSIDEHDIEIADYQYTADILKNSTTESALDDELVERRLVSHLLKTNCRVTNQPDWASIFIHYSGAQIDEQQLLKYLISFRTTQEFHEPSAERIYMDLMNYCQPQQLSVYCRYTRRGGIDINPYRSSIDDLSSINNLRVWRQ